VEQRSSASSHVYYVTDVADRFADFASGHSSAADSFHLTEQGRLQTAIRNAGSRNDKAILEETAVRNEEARLEAENAFNEMQKFVTTLKEAMGAEGRAESCQFLSCGEHAYCSSTPDRAECRCMAGYEGNGFICKSPRHALEQPLFALSSTPPRIADLHVSTLRGNHVAVVYRDVTKQHRGYLMFGLADLAGMVWKAPLPFGNGSAFGPVLVELQGRDGGVAIAFRDTNRGGTGVLVGGACNPEQNRLDLGPARAFARYQAQGMGIVALPESLVAVVFAEHTTNRMTRTPEAGAMYGSAVLARVNTNGAAPEVISKRRFASGPVARIATSMLSPTSFVVAFRQAEDSAKGERSEASCVSARLRGGGELIFDPRPLLLEPQRGQIWSRSVSLLGEGVVAYTYHSGNEQLTKQALLAVDPRTQQLGLLRAPTVISEGFTPYVGSVSTSTPFVQHLSSGQAERLRVQGPRVLAYFSGGESITPKGRFCKPDRESLPNNCQDIVWANHEVTSAAGAQVGDGRLLFVSTDASQSAYYSLVGAMEPF